MLPDPAHDRFDPYRAAPEAMKPLIALDRSVKESALGLRLVELVYLRVSQMNGCGYCVRTHVHRARAAGETDERLHMVAVWRDCALFDARERAALAWAEALTRIAETHAPDDVYAEVRRHFSEPETVALTLAVGTINTWNRVSIGFRYRHADAATVDA